jgi:hypothetical protein
VTQLIETSFYRDSADAVHPAQEVKDTETNMNTRQNTKSGSSIKQQLASINMSERVRSEALNDAGIGGLLVDAIVWVCSRFERPDASVFANPSPKY